MDWIGPTLVGIAALIQATRARREAAGANQAVNHKAPDQPSIAEQVDQIDQRTKVFGFDLAEMRHDVNSNTRVVNVTRDEVSEIRCRLDRHLAHPEEDK